MNACAAFSKESRMRFANANKFHRKSGGAKPRDLLCALPYLNYPYKRPPLVVHDPVVLRLVQRHNRKP
jgi:hypothetical protein